MDPPERRKEERRGRAADASPPSSLSSTRRRQRPDRNDGGSGDPSNPRSQWLAQYQYLTGEDGSYDTQQLQHILQQQHQQQHQQYSSNAGSYLDVDSQASNNRGGNFHHNNAAPSSSQRYSYSQQSPNSTSWGTSESFNRHSRRGVDNSQQPPMPTFGPPPAHSSSSHDYREGGHFLEIQQVPLDDNNYRRRRSSAAYRNTDGGGEDGTTSSNSRNSNSLSYLTSSLDNMHEIDRMVSRDRNRTNDTLPSLPSNSSLYSSQGRRRMRGRRSDYSVDEDGDEEEKDDNDYMVGRGRSISSHSTRGRRRRRPRSDQVSDDMSYTSYGGILDDESRDSKAAAGGGGGGEWNMNKSVFSTLPDRLGSRRDRDADDDTSIFSASSSYSYKQRTVSRSSSIASRISQASQQSSQRSQTSVSSQNSFRLPKRYRGNTARSNPTYEYDSDDSIGSLLVGGLNSDRHSHDGSGSVPSAVGSAVGGGGGNASCSDASSGSFLFDTKKDFATATDNDNDGSSYLRKRQQLAADFGDTLSHLNDLGFGIIDPTDDDEGSSHGDDEASLTKELTSKEGATNYEDDDSAWWIKELEAEGWFKYDTSTVYSGKMITVKRKKPGFGASAEDEDGDADDELDNELGDFAREPSAGAIELGQRVNGQIDEDDVSDTSTIGLDDHEDVREWEERLWSLARAHYLEYSGQAGADPSVGVSIGRNAGGNSVVGDSSIIDEQSVRDQEQLYLSGYDAEQKGVMAFRSLLLKCIETYVHAFYDQKVVIREGDNGHDGHDGVEGKETIQEMQDLISSLKVYKYIPMSTARALILEVIKMEEKEDNSVVGTGGQDNSASLEKRADIVTSLLVDDALNIFRRYQVVTFKASTKKITRGDANQRSRKRLLNKGKKSSAGDAQAELEDYLYGEMLEEEDEQGGGGLEVEDVLETKEHEIRIRSDVVKMVFNKAKGPTEAREEAKGPTECSEDIVDNSCPASSMICNVLLRNIQSITQKNTDGDDKDDNSQSSEQPISALYSLRYSPIFLLKALAASRQLGGTDNNFSVLDEDSTSIEKLGPCKVMHKDLTDLLFDESYLIKRFELQGPFDATITHLSNWQSAFDFQCNLKRKQHRGENDGVQLLGEDIKSEGESDDDREHTAALNLLGEDKSYEKVVALIVSALHSHLESILAHTGYQVSAKTKKVKDGKEESTTLSDVEKEETDGEYITSRNYANIVANCLEIGRALHHLGVCLGRRQRDNGESETIQQQSNEKGGPTKESTEADGKGSKVPYAVSLEISSYKNALDAYKAATYVLSQAESSAILDATKDLEHKKRLQRVINGELPYPQEREAPNTIRGDALEPRDMPSNDDLQEIREAKISVELHLADTLNCLGYCHDSKLSEYDKSLMAYRESLSLYIRHVGRFHKMVSNALHNMGAIHVELGQWREAASCFRQCLAILKRREEKERLATNLGQWHQSQSSAVQENQQMLITLQCLGNSLSELGEYDASVACFQEIINASLGAKKDGGELNSKSLDPSTGEVFSEMARVHINQSFKLARSFHWQCHSLLFSEDESSKKDEDPGLILSRQLHIERNAKDCIAKAIYSRRNVCYAAAVTIDPEMDSGGLFSSPDKNREGSSQLLKNGEEKLTINISVEATPLDLAALAKDLLLAGRLEFRSRSYKAALSYFWESFLINTLLISQNSKDNVTTSNVRDVLVLEEDFLKSERALFQVPDKVMNVIEFIGTPSAMEGTGVEIIQLLFLIGTSYDRIQDFGKAKSVLLKAQDLLESERSASGKDNKVDVTVREATLHIDIAYLYLKVGFVNNELGNSEAAASSYKEAIQVFNTILAHPIFSDESKKKVESGDANEMTSLTDFHRKELESILKNGLACSLHRLGQIYAVKGRSDKATKSLEDTARILNEIHDVRAKLSTWKTAPPLPLPSRCIWQELSAISTSMILSDANERSGKINMDNGSDIFSLQCFERAIGMREFIMTSVGSISTVDTESSLECFEESKWDESNMDCYSAMLMLIEKREVKNNKEILSGGEEKSWKIYNKLGIDTDMDSEHASSHNGELKENHDSMLTKEDILFRIGNLQVKLGRLKDGIGSYKEAEELTIARLGTKEHPIIMNILHNMGNSYRTISVSTLSKESRSAKQLAIECYLESIRISQASFGKQHVTAAESMQSLAVLYMGPENACLAILKEEKSDINDDEFAYKSFKESLSIRRRGNDSHNELEMASILHNLGNLCLRKISIDHQCEDAETLKIVDDAMNFLSESLKIRKVLLGQDHINTGDTYQTIGICQLNRALALKNDANRMDSEMSKAHKALTSAIQIRRACSSTPPADGSKPSDEYNESILMEAHCLFYLGRVEHCRSKYDDAKSYYIESLQLFQGEGKKRLSKIDDTDGADDLEGKLLIELEAINLWAARVLYHMANLHKVTGSINDSISCNEESLRIRSQCRGVKKHGLESALIHLALAKDFHDNQNYDKSIEHYSQSLRTYLAHFGKDSIDVADTLAGMGKSFAMKLIFDKTMQCYDKAMRVYEYREGLALKEKKGLLHREIADTIQRLDGDIFEVLEHYRSSVSFLEEFNERQRAVGGAKEKSDHDLNKRLLLYYSEMLAILRQVLDTERDKNIKAELCDEIGDVLHRMGNLYATFAEYDNAMSCFTEVLHNQRKANNDELRIADLLFNMGNIYLEQEDPEKSLECLRESYSITKSALGEDNKELHSTMYLMSVAMTNLTDFGSASKWLARSLMVLKPNNDDENVMDEVARGKTLHQMGKVYDKTGDQEKAISCLRESVHILKSAQGEDLELSNALNSLGNLLRNVSDFEQALDCYDQSLTIRAGLGDELMVANTKNNIGAVLSAVEDLDRAMAFSAAALLSKTKRLGSDSVETGRALVNMGQLYLDQKQYNNAEKYFQRGLRVFRSRMETDHPDIATCVHKLGVIKEALLDDIQALDYYVQSIHIFKNSSSPEKNVTMSFSLHNAALIHERQKDFITALDFMTEAFDTKAATLGAGHSETAASQHYLGNIYLQLEDTEAALFHFKGALGVRVELYGTDNLTVAGTLLGLAQVHFMRDEFEESIECLVENLRVLRKLVVDDEEVSKAELLLGSSYQELGQFDMANDHLLEAVHLMVSSHGENHLDVAQALFRLGICFCETNQYSESLKKFKECLEIRTALLGNLHIECANTYESIGIVQQKTECHEEAIHSFERALAIKKTSLEDDDEDFCILLHFIGSSLFSLGRYNEAVGYFNDSAERKKHHYGRADEEYSMSVIDVAAAYAKSGDKHRAMECYREAIESGGLPSDSWELGVAHKCLAGYFFDRNMLAPSHESYTEAISIFEWNISNVEGSESKQEDLIQCYVHLLDLEDENVGPISDVRADLCYKLANGYVHVGKQHDAVLMYREAIMIQSQLHGTDHLSVANSLHNLGNCYRDLSEFEKSAECLTKSLSLLSINYEEENEEVADTCHCLAMTLMSTCELEEASSLFERALAIRKKKLGALDPSIASTLFYLAKVAQIRGSWNISMKHCKEALRIQRMTVGDGSPITTTTMECMGQIHMEKREFENASLPVYLKGTTNCGENVVISTYFEEQKRLKSDKDLLSYAENVMFYGSILLKLGKYNEALECLRFSNVIFQAKYGSDHLTIAENLHQTGFILEKLSDISSSEHQLVEALELSAEALRIRKLHLVESHPDLEETLLCLGRVHNKLGNIHDALNFLTDAVKARDARVGRKHAHMDDADAFLEVGQLQQQSGQFRQALDSFEECLDIRRQILGGDHPSIGELLFYIGNLLREVGDLDLAQVKFEESLAIAEQADPDGIEAADTLFSLGVLHTEQKQYSLALENMTYSLQIHKKRGSSMVVIAEILNNIGITYFEMKEFDKAQIHHAEALESLMEELGDNHADVAFCWHSLGAVHLELCDLVEALKCFQHAVGIERTEMYLQSLGICLVKMNDNENAYVCLDEALRMKTLDCRNDADDDLAEIYRHLGIVWMRKKKFEESLKCYEEALKIKIPHCGESEKDHMNLMDCLDGALDAVSELFGTQHMKYARLLHQKGNRHGANNEHSLAIEAYVEALRIYKGIHGDAHLSVANTLFNLGVSLNAKGSPDKAIRCFSKALRITKARLGEDHLDVADTYEQIAESNKLLRRYNDTTSYYEKALHTMKQATGGSDVKSAAIMHELGIIHSQEGLWDDAERALKESVRIRTIQLGQDDPLVSESMYHLAVVYKSRDNNMKALKYFEGSLRIKKSKLARGDGHQLADNYYALGGVHSSLGNTDKAAFCYDKAIQIFSDIHGWNSNYVASSLAGKAKESGDVLSKMGDIYSVQGEGTNADSSYGAALTTYRQIFGTRHETVADVLQKMSAHFVVVGEFERGYSCVKEALALRLELLGEQDSKTGDSHYCMGTILYHWNDYEEAIKCFESAREIHKQKLGETHISVANSNFYLGCISESKGEYETAVQCLQDALVGRQEHLDEMDSQIADNLARLGHVYSKQTEWDAAVTANGWDFIPHHKV